MTVSLLQQGLWIIIMLLRLIGTFYCFVYGIKYIEYMRLMSYIDEVMYNVCVIILHIV